MNDSSRGFCRFPTEGERVHNRFIRLRGGGGHSSGSYSIIRSKRIAPTTCLHGSNCIERPSSAGWLIRFVRPSDRDHNYTTAKTRPRRTSFTQSRDSRVRWFVVRPSACFRVNGPQERRAFRFVRSPVVCLFLFFFRTWTGVVTNASFPRLFSVSTVNYNE